MGVAAVVDFFLLLEAGYGGMRPLKENGLLLLPLRANGLWLANLVTFVFDVLFVVDGEAALVGRHPSSIVVAVVVGAIIGPIVGMLPIVIQY
jgi:hypothetical protein